MAKRENDFHFRRAVNKFSLLLQYKINTLIIFNKKKGLTFTSIKDNREIFAKKN